jgi:hypothetical protein
VIMTRLTFILLLAVVTVINAGAADSGTNIVNYPRVSSLSTNSFFVATDQNRTTNKTVSILASNYVTQAQMSVATNALGGVMATDAEVAAGYQPLDSDLTSVAALATSVFGRGLLDDADASAGRTSLGVVIGTDVQAYDGDLAAIAALAGEQGAILYHNGTAWVKLSPGTSGYVLKTQGAGANPQWAEDAEGAGGADADAIHDNVSGEISAVTAKATPVAADYLLIEDSAVSNAKKSITISALEAAMEGLLDLPDLQGAVTDDQVPNTITVDLATLATTATTANAVANNSVTGAGIALASQAAGDIMYYDGTDWVRLAKGTAGQVLEMNAGATAPEWDTDDSGGAGTAGTVINTGTPTQYALPYYSDTTGTNIAPSALLTDATGTNLYVGAFYIGTLVVTNDPAFAGLTVNPLAYNATTWNGSTNVPTRDDVRDEMELKAPLASPTFTGTVTVPDNSFALGTKTTGNYAAGDAEAGAALTGDSATAFFSSGTLEDARLPSTATLDSEWDTIAEIETATSVNILVSTEADTIGELETLLGGVNVLLETEIDSGTELLALFDDETGTGVPVFSTSPTLVTPAIGAATATTPAADDNDTSVATTAFVQTEINGDVRVYEFAISDETTAITTGTAKVTWRAPHAMTVTAVRASLSTASSSGTPTVDINEGGTTILSTKLTIDANEKTSTTAAAAAVISDTAIADDAEITFDIDTAGTGAAGLKVKIYYTK